MEKFKDIFNTWIDKQIDNQIKEIDKICSELDIDPTEWFKKHVSSRYIEEYIGADMLKELLSSFIFYVSNKFDEPIKKLLPITGYNIYREPTYGILTEITYSYKKGFFFSDKEKKELKRLLRTFTISQRKELMKDKIFSYIIIQTKFKLFSKREIRALKLRSLNEYQGTIEQ